MGNVGEYLSNTAALAAPRTFLWCLPLKVPDGAPARVMALEGELPGPTA